MYYLLLYYFCLNQADILCYCRKIKIDFSSIAKLWEQAFLSRNSFLWVAYNYYFDDI